MIPSESTPHPSSPSTDPCDYWWIDWGHIILATLCGIGGLFQLLTSTCVNPDSADNAVKFFAVAAVILLLRKVKSFSFGDYKAEFAELQRKTVDIQRETKKAEQAIEIVSQQTEVAANMARVSTPTPSILENGVIDAFGKTRSFGPTKNDPWKKQFGESPKNNNRILSASVQPWESKPGFFLVRLKVESNPSDPLTNGEKVQFFLHNTFPNFAPVLLAYAGRAELPLIAWGAFTVGAVTDGGKTELELDLSQNTSFPEEFRLR